MSALDRALDLLTPGDVLERLAAYLGKPAPHFEGSRTDGMVCDFRPGCEEENASLSYKAGDRGPVFKRFGGDDAGVGAVALLESVGLTKGEAVALLLDWAGVQDEPGEGKKSGQFKPTPKQATNLDKMRQKLDKLRPMTPEDHAAAVRGFVRLEVGEDSPEMQEMARRGLTPALAAGVLTAYRWTGKIGPEGGPHKTVRLAGQFMPGVVAFDICGPDGQVWGVKGRNPGSKEELSAHSKQRYAYAAKGYSTPAHVCRIPAEEDGQATRFLVVEGELNGAACWVMLDAARRGLGYAQADDWAAGWEVQGVGSATYVPHIDHIPAGAQVYIWADPDEDGNKARENWAALLASKGCKVYQVGQTPTGEAFPFWGGESPYPPQDDACDALAPERAGRETPERHAAFMGRKLLEVIDKAQPWTPKAAAKEDRDGPDKQPSEGQGEAGDVWETKRRGYGIRGGKLCALTIKNEDGEDYEMAETLADFTARIIAEVVEEDGSGDPRRVLHIEGFRPDGTPLFPPVVEVPTAEFSGMSWPVARWGGVARIPAGQGKKDKARDAVQVLSNARGYPFQTIYLHTGWIQGPNGWFYLTADAVLGAAGAVEGISVNLPGRLAGYALPDPTKVEADAVRGAVRASLELLTLAPESVGVPLLGAAYRSVLGPSDFVVWVVGETGKHKTAFTGLVMSHFGPTWNRKHLPDGWNSSANFLEVNAFRVKDALFVVDDFKPAGGAAERAKMDGAASRIIQGAADGAGRGTLTADRRSRAGLYPRGTVATSAEDLPRGHSNRARLVVVEVHNRLISTPALSAAYFDGEAKGAAGVYALAMAAFVQALAGQLDAARVGSPTHAARVRELAPHFQGAHGRTGDAAAEVAYGWECFLSFAVSVGALPEGEALALWGRVVSALKDTAEGQGQHLAEADPTARAVGILSELLAQGRVYLADLKTGGPPDTGDALACGWQVMGTGEEERYGTKPGAELLGYVSQEGGQLWGHFLPDALHATLQEVARRQGGAALPDPSKLWGNMRDRLHKPGLMRCDEEAGRLRYTARRKTPDGTRRYFISLLLPLEEAYIFLGVLGVLGVQSSLSAFDTTLNCAPNISISLSRLGVLGVQKDNPASFSPDTSPISAPTALPPAEPPEDEDATPWAVEI